MKVIFHLDLDSYFVSAERTINKKLINKPVVISTGQRRSIISAASYEAKKYGIYIPMPYYKALELCPEIISIKPNFALYTTLSNKVFNLISNNFTNKIEVASIDECYIDVTDIWKKYGSPIKLAKKMQQKIKNELLLPSSIGISYNKFLAKMSTNLNKPFGITVTKPGNHKRFWSLDINKYYGIGRATSEKLNSVNIFTIGDLAKAVPEDIKNILGKGAKNFIDNANGIGNSELSFEYNELKGIGNSKTFMKEDLFTRDKILNELSKLVTLVAHRANIRNVVGSIIRVSIKKVGGKEIPKISKQETLKKPINSYEEILAEAINLFDDLWDERPIKFIGVSLSDLKNKYDISYQSSIFDKKEKIGDIDKIIEKVNMKFQNKVIVSGKEFKEIEIKKEKQSRFLESDRIIKIKKNRQ